MTGASSNVDQRLDRRQRRIWEIVSRSPLESLWNLQGVPVRVVAVRTWKAANADRLFGHAAELGFYFLFALFPTLFCASSILGLSARSAPQVFDRLLDFWALLTSMGASLFIVAPRPAALFGVAVWLAFLPVVVGFPALLSHLAKLAGKSRHFRGHFMEAAVGMPRVPTPRVAVMAVAAMGAELASFFFLLRAFFPTGFTTALATYPYIVLAGGLPISFSGIGVREGFALLILPAFMAQPVVIFGTILTRFLITFVEIILAALFPMVEFFSKCRKSNL